MRVTGGRLGGRRLRVPRGDRVRPTADRVRESLFAHIAHTRDLEGLRVLDAFAGTGALGVEALSRGAAEAVFIEQAAPVLAVLRENLASLELEGVTRVLRSDAPAALRRLAGAGERFDLVFLDPPYGYESLAEALGLVAGLLAEGGEAWLESARQDPLPSPSGLAILDARPYGDTQLTRWGSPPADEGPGAEPEVRESQP
ncbi:MAG: 16S rRNA (guanine(966)-N(2))-methyltransferase RsmD [Deltaproteobacteria bacterium]|nr:16S rRNA (guanine(966)-N(2))-methyltransferase RsmD [Deltaproteobacteria bacterium]MBW2445092.1 16S rRNA (guanine(966)-N(2))-methyltransferase RsmD [Deltaproteobacteria bacterium]